MLALLIGSLGTLALAPSFVATRTAPTSAARASGVSLQSVFKLPDEATAEADIARLNLECASDLPGSDNLNVETALDTLDEWVRRIRFDTDRHLYRFRENPAEYENSEPFYRMLMMTTVIQQGLGVRYNPERARNPDFRDSRDLFIHGLLGDSRTGTCSSMPVLSVALGRRLGYPLKLAQARSHLYVRWEHAGDKHLNFEATSQGLLMKSDEYYQDWPEPLSEGELASGAFLRALSPREELAVFLQMRGHCLEDNSRLAEAQVAYALAHQLFPSYPFALPFLAEAVQADLDRSPVFARRKMHAPARMPTAEESIRLADEINSRNSANLARLWRDSASPAVPWPAAPHFTGGMP